MWSNRFYTIDTSFTWLSLVVCKGERFVWKLFKVIFSNLNFRNSVTGKETRSTCCGSILFLIRISAYIDVRIVENSWQERCSWLRNNIPPAHVLHYRNSLSSRITEKWSIKTSSTEIMVNRIEAIIVEDRSLKVRKLGTRRNNFYVFFPFCEIW